MDRRPTPQQEPATHDPGLFPALAQTRTAIATGPAIRACHRDRRRVPGLPPVAFPCIPESHGACRAVRTPADFVTLCEQLERENMLEEVGGAAAISELQHAVPTSANVVHYAAIVAEKALYRRLIHTAGEMAASAYAEETDALERAEQAI